jgi:hypothetical protein
MKTLYFDSFRDIRTKSIAIVFRFAFANMSKRQKNSTHLEIGALEKSQMEAQRPNTRLVIGRRT